MRYGALLFILYLLLNSIYSATAAETQQGLVWRIDRPSHEQQGHVQSSRASNFPAPSHSDPSYLMGTMHSEDERLKQLPEHVQNIFDKADSFSAELKLDMASLQQASMKMFYTDGTELKTVIGDKRYKKIIHLLHKHNLPETAVRYMKPWAIAVTLSKPANKSGIVLDLWLYTRARQQGKKLYGLETAEEQMAVFKSFNLQQQLTMLDEAIDHYHLLPAMTDELINYYLRRDLTELVRVSDKYMARGDRQLAQHFKKHVLYERNHRMLRRMIPRLQEGNSFIAVGALHLPGEEGLLRLLEKQGYRVSVVY